MAIRRRIKNAFYTLLASAGLLIWLVALLLFSQVAENSDDFARWENWILLINLVGIALLVFLIAMNLIRLVRDYRRHVPGSRLKARMVSLLVILAVTPLVVVYVFSVMFINRGIDEWFNIDIELGLDNALELSKTALELQRRENLQQLEAFVQQLDPDDRRGIVSRLGDFRRDSRARELTIFGANKQIVATSVGDPDTAVPRQLSDEVLFQLRPDAPLDSAVPSHPSYVSLEPLADGQLQIVAAVTLPTQLLRGEPDILRAIFPVEQRLGALSQAVEASYNQFAQLDLLRTALKYSFTLTLSLVLLISILGAVYGAFFAARRLIVPIQQLMQGTRAVARGDLDTRLPVPARDEIGFLVSSFNDMTQRLASARQEANLNEQRVESERHKLEVILARLSTGVVSLEADMRIRTANAAAGAILGVDLESRVGESLIDLATSNSLLEQFLSVGAGHIDKGDTEWREQIVLRGDVGRRVLMCACSSLPSEGDGDSGYVVVFDDITALLQAQRDAAWGEVARRLAHEIKNPLTPIQLSAERMRRRYLQADSTELDLLDRATHTIIQQVEAMKEMVNAFSQYAKAPDVELTRFDLHALIAEVTELYGHQEIPVEIRVVSDDQLPLIEADVGKMRQIFHNLMRNALEAVEDRRHARVDISTRLVRVDATDMVEIKVADNGPGFSDNLVDHAFDPYVTSKPKGTGLGLAIVKKLIEEHGGQIRATNSERGGAEISILLPLAGGGDVLMNVRHDVRRERA